MTTAADIVTEALHLYGIIDATEDPTPTDIAKCSITLNNMLRNEMADGASQYLISTVKATLPAAIPGEVYSFSIGTGSPDYAVQVDAVAMRQLWMNDINLTVNRETRMAPKADVVRTTQAGIITKWHQERQSDGSVLVTAWQPPRRPSPALIEIGGRIPTITGGSSIVPLPPEGVHDATLLLGRRICTSYGKDLASLGLIIQDAEAVNKRWRDWSRGQQWLRFVRA